jgi:hypothetical protein
LDGSRVLTICKPSSPRVWHGSASFRNAPADQATNCLARRGEQRAY